MANWVYIENGEIKQYFESLPTYWETETESYVGFNLSENNLSWLKERGWYPVRKVQIDIDTNLSTVESYHYEISDNEVIETPIIRNFTAKEIEDLKFDSFLSFLTTTRHLRDYKLKESDWTQMPDVQEGKSESWKTAWKVYRQELRDLPSTITEINQVQWPTEPSDVS